MRRAERTSLASRSWLVLAALIASGLPPAFAAAPPARPGPTGERDTSGARPAGEDRGRFHVHELRLAGERHRYAVWTPPGYDPAAAWPCVVFLHGAGECGADGERPTHIGLGPALARDPGRWPVVAVFPQKPLAEEEWEEREALVLAVLERVRRDYAVDSERVALTGISQGGHGVWYLGARHPRLWSCLVPMCGYGRPITVAPRLGDLPVWAFHGLDDTVISPLESRLIVTEIRARRAATPGAPPDSEAARLTLYPGVGHDSWERAFAEPELAGWMLSKRRSAASGR